MTLSFNKLLKKKSVERATFGVKVILLLLMVILVVSMISNGIANRISTNTILTAIQTEAAAALSIAAEHQDKRPRRRDYDAITRNSLFGPLSANTPIKTIQAPIKPVSKTQLTLIGTFIVDGESATAIIEDQKKKQQEVFAEGETIFGEAKLIKVLSDRVKIDRFGSIEELVLDDSVTDKGATISEFKDGVAILNDNEILVQEAELDKALENIPQLLLQARAVPYFKDGKAVGLRMFGVKAGSLFERLGLKNGDVLKSINGNQMGDLSQAIKLFETLKQERTINVTLEREKQDRDVKYQIK